MNVEATTKPALLTGIPARLVADRVITTEQAQTAIREASKKKTSNSELHNPKVWVVCSADTNLFGYERDKRDWSRE